MIKFNQKVNKVRKSSREDSERPKEISPRLYLIISIVIIGFTMSVIYHYCLVNYYGMKEYPYYTFLFGANDSFNDFYSTFKVTMDLNPYMAGASYFPFTYIVMYLFTFFPSGFAFFIFTGSFILFFFYFFHQYLSEYRLFIKILITFILSFMSYPFLFVVDRGNLEVWVFIVLALFMNSYLNGKYFLSILFLSMAISFKLYPAILILLFIIDKKYKYAFYACLATFIMSMASAALLKGGVNATIQGLKGGLSGVSSLMLYGYHGVQHNTSFFAPMRILFDFILIRKDVYTYENDLSFYNAYYLFAAVILLVVGGFLFTYKISLWKKVCLLVLLFISLPQISFDYKLVNLFLPLILFIKSEEETKFTPYYALIFGLLLIPKDYYVIAVDVTTAVIINPLLMLSMIILILTETFRTGKKLKDLKKVKISAPLTGKKRIARR